MTNPMFEESENGQAMPAPHPDTRIVGKLNAPITELSDREIAEQTLFFLRQAAAALEQLQGGGMAKMLMGMMGSRR